MGHCTLEREREREKEEEAEDVKQSYVRSSRGAYTGGGGGAQ